MPEGMAKKHVMCALVPSASSSVSASEIFYYSSPQENVSRLGRPYCISFACKVKYFYKFHIFVYFAISFL